MKIIVSPKVDEETERTVDELCSGSNMLLCWPD